MKKTKLESDLFYYGNYLELIGSFSLSKHLTLNDLGDTPEDKAVVQKCYRDMKKAKFNGTVIDYLCWISTQFIFTTWYNESGNDYKEDENSLIFKASKDYMAYVIVPEFKSRISEGADLDVDSTVLWLLLLRICYENEIHSKNMLRLFKKDPAMVINNAVILKVMGKMEDLFKVYFTAFNILNILSFYNFFAELIKKRLGEDALNELESPWKLTIWELTLTYAYKSVVVVEDSTGILDILEEKMTKTKKGKKDKSKPKKA